MRHKTNKFLAVILIINILVIQFNMFFYRVNAYDFSTFTSEVGPTPPEIPIEDDTTPDIPSGEIETETETKTNFIYYTGISGNAYEQIHEETGDLIEFNDNPGISNIKVEAIEASGSIYTTYTDGNGNYNFPSLPAGNYRLKFTYGGYEEGRSSNIEYMKNNLKYNGLDYMAIRAGGMVKDKYTIMERNIVRTGPGATEIMLTLDCSASAWSTKVDGVKSRLELQREAAKKLVESLINEKNVYIGIVVFAGNGSATRILSATSNKDKLIETLDSIDYGSTYTALAGGTNIVEALNNSYSSFVGKESQKWVILLSDGAPTSDGIQQIYNDDTESDLLRKLRSIADNTKNRIKQIIEKKVNVCSFIVDSDNVLETELVNRIFSDIGEGYIHSSDEQATKKIKEDILKYIVTKTDVTENVTNDVQSKDFDGVEDANRRKEANSYYDSYENKNSTEIDNLINNYQTSKKDKAKDFLKGTHMTVTVKQSYTIDVYKGEDEDYWYFSLAGKKPKYKYSSISKSSYSGQNLELVKRSILDMDVGIKVTGYRLTLINGMIYNQVVTNGVVDKDLEDGEVLKDVKDIGDAIFLQSINSKEMYGARVDIEYTIIVKNTSSVPVSDVTIINYLTDFSTKTGLPILEYDETRTMISNKYTNKDYGWKIFSKEDLKDKVSDTTYSNMENDYYITINTAQSKLLRNKDNQHIGANGERYIKVVLSKYLSTDTKNENTDFSISSEILNYSNDLGIRMRKNFTNLGNKADRFSVIPGNTTEGFEKKFDINNLGVSETDYVTSMRVVIIPPTGVTENIVTYLSILIVVLLIVFIIGVKYFKVK